MLKTLVTAVAAASCFSAAFAGEPYAPMAPFVELDGKAYRAEWSDDGAKKTVDVAKYEMILGGRALQSTHRIEGSTYGGRSIIFYDEGAKKYVYHYFTTGGFHTMGTAEVKEGVFISSEAVAGHATIAEVRAHSVFKPEQLSVDVIYVGKDGSQSKQPTRVYRPVADPGELFPK